MTIRRPKYDEEPLWKWILIVLLFVALLTAVISYIGDSYTPEPFGSQPIIK